MFSNIAECPLQSPGSSLSTTMKESEIANTLKTTTHNTASTSVSNQKWPRPPGLPICKDSSTSTPLEPLGDVSRPCLLRSDSSPSIWKSREALEMSVIPTVPKKSREIELLRLLLQNMEDLMTYLSDADKAREMISLQLMQLSEMGAL